MTQVTSIYDQKPTKAAPARVSFSPFMLRSLKAPAPGPGGAVVQRDYWDDSMPGLGIRVSSTGARSWVYLARVLRNGERKPARFTIGTAREGDPLAMTLADARARAAEMRLLIAKGGDPAREKAEKARAQRDASRETIGWLIDEFLERYPNSKRKGRKPRASTVRQYEYMLRSKDFQSIYALPVVSFTRRDVNDFLDRVEKRGVTIGVNRSLQLLKLVMVYALQRGIIEHVPTDHVEMRVPETSRERHLFGDITRNRPSELAAVWGVFDCLGQRGLIPKLLMLTGQRLMEVCGMRYDELFDLDGAEPFWRIPPERVKNGKEQTIPLGPMAVKVIRSAKRRPGSQFVFPGRNGKSYGGTDALKRTIERRIEEMRDEDPSGMQGLLTEHWTYHDLRRTFKTGLAELGVAAEIRDALMNHSRPGMDSVYNRAGYVTQKREAILQWEAHIAGLLDPMQGRVVLLRAA